jgi:hypothetical protein
MVNYLYKLDAIEANHERFASKGEVVAAAEVRKLLRPARTPRNVHSQHPVGSVGGSETPKPETAP